MASNRHAAWIPIGVALGVSIGLVLDRLPLGIACGVAAGVIATALHRRRGGDR